MKPNRNQEGRAAPDDLVGCRENRIRGLHTILPLLLQSEEGFLVFGLLQLLELAELFLDCKELVKHAGADGFTGCRSGNRTEQHERSD